MTTSVVSSGSTTASNSPISSAIPKKINVSQTGTVSNSDEINCYEQVLFEWLRIQSNKKEEYTRLSEFVALVRAVQPCAKDRLILSIDQMHLGKMLEEFSFMFEPSGPDDEYVSFIPPQLEAMQTELNEFYSSGPVTLAMLRSAISDICVVVNDLSLTQKRAIEPYWKRILEIKSLVEDPQEKSNEKVQEYNEMILQCADSIIEHVQDQVEDLESSDMSTPRSCVQSTEPNVEKPYVEDRPESECISGWADSHIKKEGRSV